MIGVAETHPYWRWGGADFKGQSISFLWRLWGEEVEGRREHYQERERHRSIRYLAVRYTS